LKNEQIVYCVNYRNPTWLLLQTKRKLFDYCRKMEQFLFV